jgi:biopolymer transport protein ExbD
MKVKKSKTISAYVPTASMADIAFLLIIFFMVSAVFPLDKTQVDLPEIGAEPKNYREDSATFAITTRELAGVRGDLKSNLNEIYGQEETFFVRFTKGDEESQEIFSARRSDWMNNDGLYEDLKLQISQKLKEVEQRRVVEGVDIILILKADAKTPFFAVDAVVEALQELGGETAQGVGILAQQEER